MTETDDAARFLRDVGPVLAEDPVRNNVMLSLLEQRAAHPEPGHYWSVEAGGEIVGAVFQSPPTYPAIVSPMGPAPVRGAVAAVVADGIDLPGVSGDAATAARFAGAWTEHTRSAAVATLAQRIYEVEQVVAPAPVPGRLRPATAADHELLVAWFGAFAAEIGEPPGSHDAVVGRRIAAGQVWLWEDGAPVAFAAVTDPVAGVVRIGPVYTPPEARRRGYASAMVGRVSQGVLDRSLRCILYADLNNATSNAIYRALGYESVEEVLRYRFER